MNPKFLACLAAVAALAVPSASAAPDVPNDGRLTNYLLVAEDLSDFSGGVQGFLAERNVRRYGFDSKMDAYRVNGYLGYDLTRWLTLYGLSGVMSAKDTRAGIPSETVFAYGGGLWARLIDDDQLDILSTFTRYRLTAGLEVSHADPNDLSWTQFDGFLTFGIVNDLYITDDIFPTSITLYFGPVYSAVDLDGFSQVPDNKFGFSVGLDMTFAQGVYANAGYDFFNDDSIAHFSAGVRF